MNVSVMKGDAYVTPHMGHSHWIGKDSLSDKEKQLLNLILKKKVSHLPSPDADAQANPTGDSGGHLQSCER